MAETRLSGRIAGAFGVISILLAASFGPAEGQASGNGGPGSSSIFDRIWNLAQLRREPTDPVVQSLRLSGRYHQDYAVLDAEQGDHREWNLRRLRVGARAGLLRGITLHGEAEFNPQEADPLFLRYTDLYAQWRRSGALTLTVGKQTVPFTLDGATSSNELLTIDRSNLANNLWFPQEYMPGLSAAGTVSSWRYRLGAYSGGRANRTLGEFTGGTFTLVSIGYDLAPRLGADEALLSGQYVRQPEDPENSFTRPLDHVGSVNLRLREGRVGFRGDLSVGSGFADRGGIRGVQAMPYLDLTDRLQLVTRYTHVGGTQPNGVVVPTYESRIAGGRVDRWDDAYLGLNAHVYGHRLKAQSGIQLAEARDGAGDGGAYRGVSWVTGLRMSW